MLSKKLVEEAKIPAKPTPQYTPQPPTTSTVISKLDAELSSARTETTAVRNEINEKTEKIKRADKRITELEEMLKKANELITNKQASGSALDKRVKNLNT